MPGVPSSRACDTCRNKRKRVCARLTRTKLCGVHGSLILVQCDQGRPQCSRCIKLHVPCLGGGMQRFRFCAYTKERRKTYTSNRNKVLRNHQSILPSQVPENSSSVVSFLLGDRMQGRKMGFGVHLAHGSFIDDLPRRLAHSEALTAAAEAVIAAMPNWDVSWSLSQWRLRSYTTALKAARLALSHTFEAHSTNTMCAIYLLWICQVRESGDRKIIHESLAYANYRTGLACLMIALSTLQDSLTSSAIP